MIPTKTPDLLQYIARAIEPMHENFDTAYRVAFWIIEHITGKKRIEIISKPSLELTHEQQAELSLLLEQHVQHSMPLQYIFGTVPFLNLTLEVKSPTLIPRPETEYWCSVIIEKLKKLKNQKLTILDLCTGTGCIALSLAQAFPQAHVYAVDITSAACNLAYKNAKTNGITNVTIVKSDLYATLPSDLKFDFIVSNPPYVTELEWQTLDPLIKKWEDKRALVAEDDGIALIKKIIYQASTWVKPRADFNQVELGQLVIEIGSCQAQQVKELYAQAGFSQIEVLQDLASKDRVVMAGLTHVYSRHST